MFGIALDWNYIHSVRFMSMHGDRKSKIARQIAADLVPRFPGIVAAQHVPVFLHEEHVWTGGMHCDIVHAVADFGIRIGQFILRDQAFVGWLPRLSGIVAAGTARD